MKPHYFNQAAADTDDLQLRMAIHQGYVPNSCLLGGKLVMFLVDRGEDPCADCHGPRERCHGRPLKTNTHENFYG